MYEQVLEKLAELLNVQASLVLFHSNASISFLSYLSIFFSLPLARCFLSFFLSFFLRWDNNKSTTATAAAAAALVLPVVDVVKLFGRKFTYLDISLI